MSLKAKGDPTTDQDNRKALQYNTDFDIDKSIHETPSLRDELCYRIAHGIEEDYNWENVPDYKKYTGKPHTTTIYKDVFIHWDEDADSRVLDWFNSLPSWLHKHVYALAEHEGSIIVTIKRCNNNEKLNAIKSTFEFCNIAHVSGDEWSITVEIEESAGSDWS